MMKKECENYEEALYVLGKILILRRLKKLNVETLDKREMDGIEVLANNITNIASGHQPEDMMFYTSDIEKNEEKDMIRSRDIYQNTKKNHQNLISAFQKFIETCDLEGLNDIFNAESDD